MENSFDVIIVGAGSAGCVLANRLSRDSKVRVLLLEAGGWDWNPLISVPIGARKLTHYGLYEWGDVSEPDPTLNGRRLLVPHGKVIGGTSSINYMAHTRGHRADFDRWAAKGATGWSYEEVLPFFKETETWQRGEDAWRGGQGELGAQEATMPDPIYKAWFAAARALGYPVTDDYNGEHFEGIGPAQYTVKHGMRASAGRVFLKPALGRPNLTVRTRAMATKLLFEGATVVGVEYVHRGKTLVARAAQRTVLCLGAINTPQLLMLSGIGPADHLRSLDIKPIVDLPVGQNLEDHLGVAVYWSRKTPGPFLQSLRLDRVALNMARAYFLKEGPATRPPGVLIAFVRSEPALPQPDLELIVQMIPANADFWIPGLKPPYVDGYGIRPQITPQGSRGEIRLRSADPRDRPRIFYNSLSDPRDVAALRAGVRRSLDLGNSPELADFRAHAVVPEQALKTDAEIDAFVRANAIQLYHPACTCRMGDDETAVVNPDLSVRGVRGLNVVDASVMPHLVSANPNVVVMMMAARVASLWRQSPRSV